jgi:hypothetical protein
MGALMDRKAVLLATIESALSLEPKGGRLSAKKVNDLGRRLGLSDEDVFEFVRQLSSEGAIDLEWGGNVKSVRPETKRPSIHLEEGATYVGDGASANNAAIGAHARVLTANESDQKLIPIVAQLTVAIEKLTLESASLQAEYLKAFQQVISLNQSMVQQLLKGEKVDKSGLKEKMDEAEGALKITDHMITIGANFAARWPMLHQVYEALKNYLGVY